MAFFNRKDKYQQMDESKPDKAAAKKMKEEAAKAAKVEKDRLNAIAAAAKEQKKAAAAVKKQDEKDKKSYIEQLRKLGRGYTSKSRKFLVDFVGTLKRNCDIVKSNFPDLEAKTSKNAMKFSTALINRTYSDICERFDSRDSKNEPEDAEILKLLEETKNILQGLDDYLLTQNKPKKETDKYDGYDKEAVFDTWKTVLLNLKDKGYINGTTVNFHAKSPDALRKQQQKPLSVSIEIGDEEQSPRRNSPGS